MKRLVLALLFCTTTLSAAVLMRDGEVMAEIVCFNGACSMEKFAAEELAYHLKLITGKDFPIVDTETGTKTPIRIGWRTTLPRDGWTDKNDGTVKITEDAVELAGIDSNAEITHLAFSAGSARAVYSFLEKELGVRWLWPGKSGIHAPKKTDIEVAPAERSVGTRFKWLWWWVAPASQHDLWKDPKNADRYAHETSLWMRRMGFTTGYGSLGSYGHSFEKTYNEFGRTNPEMFNLLPDGTRVPSKLYVSSNPIYITMCVSNPAVEQYLIDRWEENRFLNVAENDAPGQCVCRNCLAADLTGNDAERFARAKALFMAGDKGWFWELGSVTNRYAALLQRLIAKMRVLRPDSDNRALFYAYGNYWRAPSPEIKLDKTALIYFAPPFAYPITREQIEDVKNEYKGWSESGADLIFRTNTTHDGHNFPLVYHPEFLEFFDFAAEEGLFGICCDRFTGALAGNSLTLYTIATRFSHDDDRSVSELEDEFCNAFGPAADDIRAYWDLMRQATLNGYDKFGPSKNFVGNDFYGWFYLVAPKVFTDEIFARGLEILERAKEKVADDQDLLEKVEFLIAGATDARLTLAVQVGYEEMKRKPSSSAFVDAVRALDDFRNSNEDKLYSNIGHFRNREDEAWPRHLAKIDPNAIRLKWEICFDPSAQCPSNGQWHSAYPEMQWEQLPAGIEYEKTHGKPYKGAAWYRAVFNLSAEDAKQIHRIRFGAVDGSGWYYLNGKGILIRPWPFNGNVDSWQEAFEITVSPEMLQAGENTLFVRVEKPANAGLSGIWRPVTVSKADSLTVFIQQDVRSCFDPDAHVASNGHRSYSVPNVLAGKPWDRHPRATEKNTFMSSFTTAMCRPNGGGDLAGVKFVAEVNQQTPRPIIFSIESRAKNASGPYTLALDMIFQDGTAELGLEASFLGGTFDWCKSGGIYQPSKPIKTVYFYGVCKDISGEIEFRNPELYLK